jgi:flagellar basal body P-ring formation protein FlgA
MMQVLGGLFLAVAVLLAIPVNSFAQGHGEMIVAARTLRAGTVLGPGDIRLAPASADGAITDPGQAIGQETRIAIYTGRAIYPGDLAPPALVDRNQIVRLVFRSGGLSISADGRALGRASEGEMVRVMNLASRATVSGVVAADGAVHVLGAP